MAKAGAAARIPASLCALAGIVLTAMLAVPSAQGGGAGLREPVWAPDGKHVTVVSLDRLWTVLPDGRDGHELTRAPGIEREPAYSRDGRLIAFAADRGDGFDLYTVAARGGTPQRITGLRGDERSPTWTPDGRIVFAFRATTSTQWDLYIVDPDADTAGGREPQPLTNSPDDEMCPQVSPDGRRVAFASNRDNEDGDFDIWVLRLLDRDPSRSGVPRRGPATRVTSGRGYDAYPAWSPDGSRLAFYALRDGVGSTWVTPVMPLQDATAAVSETPAPVESPVLVSRHGGTIAWSPDGRTLAIGEIPQPDPVYNGNPRRDGTDGPPLSTLGQGFQLWTVPAPRPIDEGTRALTPAITPGSAAFAQAFDNVWSTLRRLYYSSGERARTWDAVKIRLRPRAEQAHGVTALEDVIDEMVAAQPLVKPPVSSSRAVVVSAHPLASEVGRRVLARGGNVVDAAVAVAFALGVVEPDASGIGGDGQAIVYLRGMARPTVVEYKDQTPKAAALDNPRLFRNGRLIGDGPLSVNVPGVVAGLDYLHEHYGSGAVSWADLIEPAIGYAEDGFTLDQTLPSTVAEARRLIEKYPATSRLFLPARRLLAPGDRFVNRDLASTLRTLAREGADAFYRGTIADRIAGDMDASGGLLTLDDLAQYQAIERQPVTTTYRGHVLYTTGPPVALGVSTLEAFEIFDQYTPKPLATITQDPDYWHYAIEAWKARDRVSRIADPAQWHVEFDEHLTAAHARELFTRIDPAKASRFADDAEEPPALAERIGSGTTAIVVADADGNMVAMTNTLSTWGGSFYVSRGLGFLYNNHLRANRTTPGTYGQLLPRTRSNTANVPMLVFRDRAGLPVPRLAISVAGNAWIPAATYSIVTGVIDGGLSMQQAVEAPRFLVVRDPADSSGTAARVEIEDRFPRTTVDALVARGHRFQKIGRKGELRYGYASGVEIDVNMHRVDGGADPRRSHAAIAY